MKWKLQNSSATLTTTTVFGFTICRTKKLKELLQNKENCIKNLRERINQLYYGN